MLSSAAVKDIGAGTSAGIVSVLVCHPLDTIRVRLQTAPSGRFSGVADVVRQTVRSEGPLALYKGMAFPLAAQGLQKATMFVSFGLARRFMLEKGVAAPGQPLPLSAVFLCGSFAGVCNTLVANPFELGQLAAAFRAEAPALEFSGAECSLCLSVLCCSHLLQFAIVCRCNTRATGPTRSTPGRSTRRDRSSAPPACAPCGLDCGP